MEGDVVESGGVSKMNYDDLKTNAERWAWRIAEAINGRIWIWEEENEF